MPPLVTARGAERNSAFGFPEVPVVRRLPMCDDLLTYAAASSERADGDGARPPPSTVGVDDRVLQRNGLTRLGLRFIDPDPARRYVRADGDVVPPLDNYSFQDAMRDDYRRLRLRDEGVLVTADDAEVVSDVSARTAAADVANARDTEKWQFVSRLMPTVPPPPPTKDHA